MVPTGKDFAEKNNWVPLIFINIMCHVAFRLPHFIVFDLVPSRYFSGLKGQLTLAMCPIVGDEGGHVVGGAVACQAGAEVAAVRVVAGGVLPTDPMGS